MTLKPPTRTLPKLVMKEWPKPTPEFMGVRVIESPGIPQGGFVVATKEQISNAWVKALSSFTRVGEDIQKETPLTKRAPKHD